MQENRAKHERVRDEFSLGLLMMVWLFRVVLVLIMMAGVCKLSALPIRMKSVECVVVLGAYAFLLIMLQEIYNACDVGQFRVVELLMSQVLANVISAGAVYLGVALYVHKLFNPLMLILVVAVQCILGMFWSKLANRNYFRGLRRPHTAVICHNEAEYTLLCQSPYFHDRYDVVRVIRQPEEDIQRLRAQLEGCEVVFTMNVPATYAHGIAKLCLEMGIKGYFAPRLGHIIMAGAEHRTNFSVPLLRVERAGRHSEYRFFKRAFDLVASAIGLVVLSPVMLATAIAIWAEDHGPVLYRQVRLTKNGRPFHILKFRSMTVNAEKDGVARLAGENDSRITKVGHFIRACRIDELPQLLNILMGDMSIVGPRPERPEIAKQYEETLPEFSLRLQVKAGLTGLAQVYGRYNTEPYHKLQMDLMYIEEMSFLKDLQLILATIRILFIKDSTQGIAQGQETALNEKSSKRAESA